MSRFTISPSFPLLSLLPLSSLLDDPSLSPPPRLSFCPSSRLAVFRFFTPPPYPLQLTPAQPAPPGVLLHVELHSSRLFVLHSQTMEKGICKLRKSELFDSSNTKTDQRTGVPDQRWFVTHPSVPRLKKNPCLEILDRIAQIHLLSSFIEAVTSERINMDFFFPGKVWVGVRTSWWV